MEDVGLLGHIRDIHTRKRPPSGTAQGHGRNTYCTEGGHDQYCKRPPKGTQSNMKKTTEAVPVYLIFRHYAVTASFRPPYVSPCPSSSKPARVQSWSSSEPSPKLGSPLELHRQRTSATGQRRCQSVCGFTSLFSDRILHGSACEVADALLELLDVFLVGGGDLVDLV